MAAAAGVSEATVYGVFGNKAGLATALIDGVDEEADVARASTELDAATGDPTGQLAAVIGFDRRLFERGGGIIATIIEGRRDYAELDAAYQEGADAATPCVARCSAHGRRRCGATAWTPSALWTSTRRPVRS